MKKVFFILSLWLTVISCQSSKKETSIKIEQSVTPLEKVTTDQAFFNAEGREVTPETYPTDETSRQMLKVQTAVGVNEFLHKRELTPTDEQPVVRMNRDTYYSTAVVDVSEGASVTIPEVPEGKYVSVQSVTEDHRIQAMKYGPGTFDLATHVGTHLYLVIRLDATLTEEEVKEIQDQMSIQANADKKFEASPVNEESFTKVEEELKAKQPGIVKRDGPRALEGMFTDPNDASNELFTEEKYQVGAAIGWGGAQMKDNIYEVSGNYATDSCYQLTFEDPGNEAFWSITVYDKNGFMFSDLANYSSNTAQANEDGTYTISFGCGDDAPNNLAIENPTNYFNIAIRHYKPSSKVMEEDYRLLPMMKSIK
ncbi:DUF1254 domain-containing protein [Algivirga pacifica]|uniref:DUF1254 domain-containing protein n=1 Tax=Algivirga pacifica TaxID=1162670 RepID=A0ABP9D3U2_9BACT